ncbi:MAG: internal scaffolding protein [Microviridae sp.]|nr:MAG: internal scaffolding protein [Microviridae sp.]
MMKLRAAYGYDTDQASRESALAKPIDPDTGEIIDDGLTQQQFKEESDINTIVKRFGLTGELPVNERMPISGDFTGVTDFQSALNAVTQAQQAFNDLPAELRYRFNNDPGRLLSFLDDVQNIEEAVKLGIVVKPKEAPRDAVKAIDDLAAKIVPPEAKK